jgi:hypothetical protein
MQLLKTLIVLTLFILLPRVVQACTPPAVADASGQCYFPAGYVPNSANGDAGSVYTPVAAPTSGCSLYEPGCENPGGSNASATTPTEVVPNSGSMPGACQSALNTVQQSCRGNSAASQAANSVQSAASSFSNTNSANAAAKAACNAEMLQGGTSLANVAMVLAPCKTANVSCQAACASGPAEQQAVAYCGTGAASAQCQANYVQAAQNNQNNCAQTFQGVEAAAALAAGTSLMAFNQALNCDTGTSDTTVPGPIAGLPVDPVTDPNSGGFNGYSPTGQAAASYPSTGDGSGGSGAPLGGAGYPGGSGAGAAGANQGGDSGIEKHALGLAGGNGSGWPSFGSGGAGWGGGGGANNPLAAYLPCNPNDPTSVQCLKDPKRGLAGEVQKEISGANDLTNFQKVTRMMNKKRPVLKSGDGA